MKTELLLTTLLSIGISIIGVAQTGDTLTHLTPEGETAFEVADSKAEYPGGPAALLQMLNEKITYPPAALDSMIQGRVFVQLIIEKDGSVSEYTILKSPHPLLSEETLRVLKSDKTLWKPGTKNGVPVRTFFKLPVVFRLK